MRAERVGTSLLAAAIVLVAFSILLEGSVSRMLNGVAGVTWFASAVFLVIAVRQGRSRPRDWIAAVVLTALVAFVVTPSDFLPAIVGFGLAGAAVALIAGESEVLWAKVIVGLYLPLHVGTALVKAVWRAVTDGEASIRTDPPPTAALVPMAMLLSAVAAALLVREWRRRQRPGAKALTTRAATE